MKTKTRTLVKFILVRLAEMLKLIADLSIAIGILQLLWGFPFSENYPFQGLFLIISSGALYISALIIRSIEASIVSNDT